MCQSDDRDADAYAGLGEAELALENYQEARDAFQKALQRNPSDQASKKQLELIEQRSGAGSERARIESSEPLRAEQRTAAGRDDAIRPAASLAARRLDPAQESPRRPPAAR